MRRKPTAICGLAGRSWWASPRTKLAVSSWDMNRSASLHSSAGLEGDNLARLVSVSLPCTRTG